MVFDVPAESGGALSVLYEFYNEFKVDHENEYIFVLSVAELEENSNIQVLRFPWIKKSWVHRLYFDQFIAPKLIKEHKIDRILSLQNLVIPHSKAHQSVFIHNALPFSDYRFSLKNDKLLWIYQNIIGKVIIHSIKKANRIIVQTNWMKKTLVEKLDIYPEKIEIKPTKIDFDIRECFRETKESLSTFFYPASGVTFKNHKVIVDACLKLKEENINGYKVIFTLSGKENQHISELYNIVKKNKLPIEFAGSLSRSDVFLQYTKSILIFPSYIETVGLPLLEARNHCTPIISVDLPYSKEILYKYENVIYFNTFNSQELKVLMEYFISKIPV